jgi:hypothetical protein
LISIGFSFIKSYHSFSSFTSCLISSIFSSCLGFVVFGSFVALVSFLSSIVTGFSSCSFSIAITSLMIGSISQLFVDRFQSNTLFNVISFSSAVIYLV